MERMKLIFFLKKMISKKERKRNWKRKKEKEDALNPRMFPTIFCSMSVICCCCSLKIIVFFPSFDPSLHPHLFHPFSSFISLFFSFLIPLFEFLKQLKKFINRLAKNFTLIKLLIVLSLFFLLLSLSFFFLFLWLFFSLSLSSWFHDSIFWKSKSSQTHLHVFESPFIHPDPHLPPSLFHLPSFFSPSLFSLPLSPDIFWSFPSSLLHPFFGVKLFCNTQLFTIVYCWHDLTIKQLLSSFFLSSFIFLSSFVLFHLFLSSLFTHFLCCILICFYL